MNFKLPTFSQFKQIGKTLNRKEKITFLSFFIVACLSFVVLIVNVYLNSTKPVPAFGGTYVQGVVGQPRFINPIYGETNDIDRSLLNLVFSGLMTYSKNGKLEKDLVSEYKISPDGKVYTFTLKDNIFWHDGQKLTVDDVIFTINTIQNSDYKSPLRANWIDVDAQKISEQSFTLTLNNSYNGFLENCTLKILPKHIWQNILPENFALSSYNLQPIGSGPYKFESIKQTSTGFISNLKLSSNKKYYSKVPYILNIAFDFFESKDDLIAAANKNNVSGFSLTSLDNNDKSLAKEIKDNFLDSEKFVSYDFYMPRYFAVFFNPNPAGIKSKILGDNNIKQALNLAVDKNDIAKQIQANTIGKISVVTSPILPDFYGYNQPTKNLNFDLEKAKDLLNKAGFPLNAQNQREKIEQKKPAFQFKSYLAIKSKGTEVTELQKCLGKFNFSADLSGETNGTYGQGTEKAVTSFQQQYLPDQKPTGEVGSSTRKKLNELCLATPAESTILKITLTTINQPQLVQVANIIKYYWQNAGIEVNVQVLSLQDLKNVIKDRSYEALLYGEALGAEPDLYPFWHSTQISDPGLNLSEYQSKAADDLLKSAREEIDLTKKQQDYEKLQDIIIQDSPALFLYNPDYVYLLSNKILGIDTTKIIDPAKIFSNISNWYIKTKRVFK